MLTLAVSVAAGLGAVARYLLDHLVRHRVGRPFPYGTLLINVSGSLLLGLVLGLAAHHGLGSATVAVLGTGFVGGFTTLSTWAYESVALARFGLRRQSVVNVAASFALGLAAAAAGFGLALL